MEFDPQNIALLLQGSVAGGLAYLITNGIKKWVPPKYRSVACLLLALVISVAWEAATGKNWLQAVALAITGGGTAVGVHEWLTKALQGNTKPKADPPPA